MIYKLNISKNNNLVTITARGIYSLKDIKRLIHLIIEDPHYKATYNIIIDISAIKYTPIVSEISVISSFIISLKHYFKGKTAIVAEGELIYSMFKLSTLLLTKQGLKSSIFHNPEEALTWIKDPDPKTDSTSSQ
ncbi:MAG: hypothetical protein KAR21_22640 [Spirochaetales bacterium]|nr:hypothetical protein [Spirochaetales bacterium]